MAGFHYVAVVDGRAACTLNRATDSEREVAGESTNDGDDGDRDAPSSWNEPDSSAVTTCWVVVVQDRAGPDDDGMDDEAGGVVGSPNAGRDSSPMRGKDSLATNLKRERKKKRKH